MSYAEILKDYILKSEKTLEQIVRECQDRGITIHATYVSKLRLGQRPAADGSISRVLAEVTGGDPERLIAAGYIERAPEEVRSIIAHYLNHLDFYTAYVASLNMDQEKLERMSKEDFSNTMLEKVEKFKSIPFEERIDYVINLYNRAMISHPNSLIKHGKDSGASPEQVNKTLKIIEEGTINRITLLDLRNGEEGHEWVATNKIRFGEFVFIIMGDDSMSGAGINIGAKLLCQLNGKDVTDENGNFIFVDGKIYAIFHDEDIIVRRAFKTSTGYVLQSENPEFPPIIINTEAEPKFKFLGIIKSVEFPVNTN